MAARSNAWVYYLSLAGIAGSNPTVGIDVSLVNSVCQVAVSATGLSFVQRTPT